MKKTTKNISVNLNKGSELMIKKIAWDAFKNTGDINSFLEFKQIENIENNIINKEEVRENGIEKRMEQ